MNTEVSQVRRRLRSARLAIGVFAGACLGLGATAFGDTVIFEDTFEDFSQWPGGPAGNPEPDDPAERILEITDENSELFFGEADNPYLRFYKNDVPENVSLSITATNAFSEPSEVITIAFDFWYNTEVGTGIMTLMTSSGSITANRWFHLVQLGNGTISGGTGMFRPDRRNRIEIVKNNSTETVSYAGDAFTVASDTMDVWIDGVRVLDDHTWSRGTHDAMPVGAPFASIRFAVFTIQRAEILIDNLVIHKGAVIEEVVPAPLVPEPLVEFTFEGESLANSGMLGGAGAFDQTARMPAFGPGVADGTAMDNSSASGMGTDAIGDGQDGAMKYNPGTALNGLRSVTVTGWFRHQGNFNNRAFLLASSNSILVEGNNNMFQFNPLTTVDGAITSRWLRSNTNWHQENGRWTFFAVTADVTDEAEGLENAFMYYAYDDSAGITLDASESFIPGPMRNISQFLAIGNLINDHPFQGEIDNLRIWGSTLDGSGALSAGQIEAIWAADLGIEPPGPPEIPSVRLFWSELDLGEIQAANADGSARGTLLGGLNRPIGIAIDEEGGLLYWTEDGVASNTTGDGRIGRANLDGSDAVYLYDAAEGDAGLDNPQSVALHRDGGWIYWTDHHSGVYRAPLDGSGPVEPVYTDTWNRFTNLALDLVNSHVYFGNPQTGDLYRTDLEGNNFDWVSFGMTATWAFNGLAVDPDAGRLYFPDASEVKSSNLSGNDVQTLASGLGTPLGVALGPDRQHVFYAERTGRRIGVVKTDGAEQQILITGLDNPFGVAVLAVAPGVTFQSWAAGHFSPEDLADETIGGPGADPAGDGIPNIVKYAFGLDPWVSGRQDLPAIVDTEGETRFSYIRRTDTSDIAWRLETSADLFDWEPAGDEVEIVGIDDLDDGFERVNVRVTAAAGARLFLRVRIEWTQ